jgi:N-formylglutamate amidohydrolase
MKIKVLLKIPFLTAVTIVFFLFLGCEVSEPDQTGHIWVDTENDFPELGHDGPYFEDSIYFGREEYIEYHSGSLPIILSAPHGGWKEPTEIPDRTEGTTITDINTYQLTKVIMDSLTARFGGKPHVILCLLERLKLDANREEAEAAAGNIYAERAWAEYHHYLDIAKELVTINHGNGIVFDIHGHGENPDGNYDLRTWLGYLIKGDELDLPDEELNTAFFKDKSSIRALVDSSSYSFVNVIHGETSLGAILDSLGFASVPSVNDLGPAGSRYLSGGYITIRHGSRDEGIISAIQVELPQPGIRDIEENWSRYASTFVTAVGAYYGHHLGRSIHP